MIPKCRHPRFEKYRLASKSLALWSATNWKKAAPTKPDQNLCDYTWRCSCAGGSYNSILRLCQLVFQLQKPINLLRKEKKILRCSSQRSCNQQSRAIKKSNICCLFEIDVTQLLVKYNSTMHLLAFKNGKIIWLLKVFFSCILEAVKNPKNICFSTNNCLWPCTCVKRVKNNEL